MNTWMHLITSTVLVVNWFEWIDDFMNVEMWTRSTSQSHSEPRGTGRCSQCQKHRIMRTIICSGEDVSKCVYSNTQWVIDSMKRAEKDRMNQLSKYKETARIMYIRYQSEWARMAKRFCVLML